MSVKADPNFLSDLRHFGLKDASKCFHCGNCTAICPLSEEGHEFPRRFMRYAQLGLKDKIYTSPEPWLCYYCGECSAKCPRGADPGEAMMVMRRYLTSRYDWTGFSRRFYTSETFEIVAVVAVALLVALGMLIFNTGHPNWEQAHLNSVWPKEGIELADLGMAAILTVILLGNVFRCIKAIMGDLMTKIPLGTYLGELKELIIHTVTQKQFAKCEDRMQWFVHLMIMTGYATVFLLVVVGIRWFQRDEPYGFWHPISLLGFYSTFAIMYGTTYAIIGRLRKSKPPYANSHGTDWMFLILLQLTTMTGIIVRTGIWLDWAFFTYAMYVIHLAVAIPMLVLEVPFAKWAHLAYRPLVLFLLKVKTRYATEQAAKTATEPVPEAAEA